MEDIDDHTYNLLRNMHNIDLNEKYIKDSNSLEKSLNHAWNERACGQQKQQSELQFNDYFLCTGNKPCTYKSVDRNVQQCGYMKQLDKVLTEFYNRK